MFVAAAVGPGARAEGALPAGDTAALGPAVSLPAGPGEPAPDAPGADVTPRTRLVGIEPAEGVEDAVAAPGEPAGGWPGVVGEPDADVLAAADDPAVAMVVGAADGAVGGAVGDAAELSVAATVGAVVGAAVAAVVGDAVGGTVRPVVGRADGAVAVGVNDLKAAGSMT